jgi:hypothetical protein
MAASINDLRATVDALVQHWGVELMKTNGDEDLALINLTSRILGEADLQRPEAIALLVFCVRRLANRNTSQVRYSIN